MLGRLLTPDYEELIRAKDWASLREAFSELEPSELAEVLENFSVSDAVIAFRLLLPRDQAADAFEHLPLDMQTELVAHLPDEQLVRLLDEMAPDDRTRLLEELPAEVTKKLLATLSPEQRKIARYLLGYPERSAGRYMTPEYVSIRTDMTVSQAFDYIRAHGKHRETVNVLYVTDARGRLLDDVSLSALVLADPDTRVGDVDDGHQLVSIPATTPGEDVVATFKKYDRVALPVTDTQGVLVGIITVDDVLDVQAEEATEDIQKIGGMESLGAPYLDISLGTMVRKRAGWLSALFIGEMLTATAMAHFERQIERAVVLALFVPLIISSGGNSGSQATTLIIRSLAQHEMKLSDWHRVLGREIASGLILGTILGLIGLVRIMLWPTRLQVYGPHYAMVALTVAASLVGVVLFGTLAGSMLPFLLSKLKQDPATSSAPFVATLVDVTGLVIYFTMASVILKGVLL